MYYLVQSANKTPESSIPLKQLNTLKTVIMVIENSIAVKPTRFILSNDIGIAFDNKCELSIYTHAIIFFQRSLCGELIVFYAIELFT